MAEGQMEYVGDVGDVITLGYNPERGVGFVEAALEWRITDVGDGKIGIEPATPEDRERLRIMRSAQRRRILKHGR